MTVKLGNAQLTVMHWYMPRAPTHKHSYAGVGTCHHLQVSSECKGANQIQQILGLNRFMRNAEVRFDAIAITEQNIKSGMLFLLSKRKMQVLIRTCEASLTKCKMQMLVCTCEASLLCSLRGNKCERKYIWNGKYILNGKGRERRMGGTGRC